MMARPSPPARRRRTILAALAALAACGGADRAPDRAAATFAAFQRALQAADAPSCRALLTIESQAALADMPWREVAARRPLEVVGARREGNDHTFLVDVRDPNEGGAAGAFVVVREHGRLVVDLVASAALTAEHVEVQDASAAREQFEPRALTPADLDRVRAHELSQPPGQKARGN